MTIPPSCARSRLVSTVVRPFRAAVALLSLATAGLGGCVPFGDPAGPGASGEISLGAGVETEGFKSLALRATPASDGDFDPTAPSFRDADGEGSGWYESRHDLAEATFPFEYSISETLGTTPHQRWRLFAWLSKGVDESRPASGEPYGTVVFEVEDCGSFGDYCGVTRTVDLAIDKTAP